MTADTNTATATTNYEDLKVRTHEEVRARAEKYNPKTGLIAITQDAFDGLDDASKADIEEHQRRHTHDVVYLPKGTYKIYANTGKYPISDDGIADMILTADGIAPPIICEPHTSTIYVWSPGETINGTTGGHWAADATGARINAILDTICDTITQAMTALNICKPLLTDDNKKEVERTVKILAQRYSKVANTSSRNGIVEMLKRRTCKMGEMLDRNPESLHLISCRNGLVDVRTGDIRDAHPEDYITRMAPVIWDPNAQSPIVDKYIDDISNCNDAIKRQMAQTIGMAMDAGTPTKTMSIMYGPATNNGKTTFLNVLSAVLGQVKGGNGYVMQMPVSVLQKARSDSAGRLTPELVGAESARLITMSEPAENFRVNSAELKNITGGGRLVVNPKYKDQYEIEARFTLTIDTNYTMSCDDPTVFRSGRIQILPFMHEFSGVDRDPHILDKLSADDAKSALLRWIVAGAIDWHTNGWQISPEGQQMLDRYAANSDYMRDFLDSSYIITGNTSDRIMAKDVYADYADYCIANGMQQVNQTNLRSRLSDRGISVVQVAKVWTVIGIRRRLPGEANGVNLDLSNPIQAALDNLLARNAKADATPMADVMTHIKRWWTAHGVTNQPADWRMLSAISGAGYNIVTVDGCEVVKGVKLVDRVSDKARETQRVEDMRQRIVEALKDIKDEHIREILGAMVKGPALEDAILHMDAVEGLPF